MQDLVENRSADSHTIYAVRYQYDLTTYIVRMTAGKIFTPEMVPPCWRQSTPINDIYTMQDLIENRSADSHTI